MQPLYCIIVGNVRTGVNAVYGPYDSIESAEKDIAGILDPDGDTEFDIKDEAFIMEMFHC